MSKLYLVATKENEMVLVEKDGAKLEVEAQARKDGYKVVGAFSEKNIESLIKGEGKLYALMQKRNKKSIEFIRNSFGTGLTDLVSQLLEQGMIELTDKELYEQMKVEARELVKGTDTKVKCRFAGKKYRIELV